MINRIQLLADLQAMLRKLEADLLERSEEMSHVREALAHKHQRARAAERTAQSYEEWRSDYITQIAAAWVLSCVFVRFMEDNRLVDPPMLAGPGERPGELDPAGRDGQARARSRAGEGVGRRRTVRPLAVTEVDRD